MLLIRPSDKLNVGDGLFADRDYAVDEVILDWGTEGEIIDQKEFYGNYLYYDNAIQTGEDSWIFHPIARYINHSCEPNCKVSDKNFVAVESIQKGNEIIIDYSSTENSKWIARFDCLCGHNNCRKTIKSFWMLDEKDKSNMKNLLSEWIKEKEFLTR